MKKPICQESWEYEWGDYPCFMCTHREWCEDKPRENKTCEAFEHEDPIVEAQHPDEMSKIRGI